MKIIIPGEKSSAAPSIFLAGPTPRLTHIHSWRKDAVSIFQKKSFEGELYIPEPFAASYDTQVNWEWEHLAKADVIMFWVPREENTLPGYTTNVEFGLYATSGKIVLGAPEHASKMRYLLALAKKNGIAVASTLEKTIDLALEMQPMKTSKRISLCSNQPAS